ncbi:helix-turn-helix transcriptional regulator [Mesorhizobium australafricanum]|uniref:Helix-turn-helix transcriptional regulator n=1 Tax=Mesorhizobium australafricanum TaxID=3072311 RepID=A0ABU4X6Q8_9HYPH|nr:helix-turn-helix transcriptional regulator [Mesorhizobium sp. VK3E]MDX8443643.1 helix-turn-helix transcriptional regulator [Mesorhizobium sp. VK3E]
MTLIHGRNDLVAGSRYIALRHQYARQVQSPHFAKAPDRSDEPAGGFERRSLESITGMIERIGCGYLVLDGQRKVIEWNAAARATIERQGDQADTATALALGLKRLVADVPVHFHPGSLSWVVIRSRGDRPVVLNEMGVVAHDGTCIVALLDRDNRSAANPRTLQRMFGLTGAETQLALRLALGDAPLDIARSWRLSRTTIRSQLASLFAKTETKRQGELVALLARISVLP